jgi:hypothetical protein
MSQTKVQNALSIQAPSGVQIWDVLPFEPAQRVVPGRQTPEQAALRQTNGHGALVKMPSFPHV